MGVPIEDEVNKVFLTVPSQHLGIVKYLSQKTLRKTIYFTGVPIEGEVNKVFLGGSKSTVGIAEYISQKIL